MVLSLFAHFWRQFLSDFDVWPLISKLMIYSTSIWSNFATRELIRHLKMAKCVQKSASSAILSALEAPSGNVSWDSCRTGHKLWNEFSNIKIRQELTAEMRKMWGNLKMLISQKLDKISKFQAYIWNQQKTWHGFVILLNFLKNNCIDLDDSVFFHWHANCQFTAWRFDNFDGMLFGNL